MQKTFSQRMLYRLLCWVSIVFGAVMGLVYWKIDYIYEVALFNHLGKVIQSGTRDNSPEAMEAALFKLTNHQVLRHMHFPGEKSPLVFLLNGFALCDQQAKVLTRLLYFRDIKARAVPLYFASGLSNHTIFEWFDRDRWVIADPFLHFPINIPAPEFCVLDTRSARSQTQKHLIDRAYSYYETNQGLLQELRETYARSDHATWEYFRRRPETRLAEGAISVPLRIWPGPYLDFLNTAYQFRHVRSNPLLNQYLKARHQELMGDCQKALTGYRALLPLVEKGGQTHKHLFVLNRGMLKLRIVSNRMHCGIENSGPVMAQ